MKKTSFKAMIFVASPSGILITFGFLTVALATAVNLPGISFGLGTAGSIAVVAGLSRRLIRSEERYKSSYQTQKRLQQELSQLHARNERSKADFDRLIHKSETQDNNTQKDVSIGDVRLAVLGGNLDADWYGQRSVHEERHSPLYDLVNEGDFRSFIDVGANYGFVSILARLQG